MKGKGDVTTMEYQISAILLSQEELAARVREIGETIGRDYAGKELVVSGGSVAGTSMVGDSPF